MLSLTFWLRCLLLCSLKAPSKKVGRPRKSPKSKCGLSLLIMILCLCAVDDGGVMLILNECCVYYCRSRIAEAGNA